MCAYIYKFINVCVSLQANLDGKLGSPKRIPKFRVLRVAQLEVNHTHHIHHSEACEKQEKTKVRVDICIRYT